MKTLQDTECTPREDKCRCVLIPDRNTQQMARCCLISVPDQVCECGL